MYVCVAVFFNFLLVAPWFVVLRTCLNSVMVTSF